MLLQLRSREFRKTKSNLSREHESTGRRVDPQTRLAGLCSGIFVSDAEKKLHKIKSASGGAWLVSDMHRALRPGGDIAALEMLRSCGARIDAVDEKGRTALYIAAAEGQNDVVEWLLSNGADPLCCASHDGRSALHAAAANGQVEACELLLTAAGLAGISKFLAMPDLRGNTAAELAHSARHLDVVRCLLALQRLSERDRLRASSVDMLVLHALTRSSTAAAPQKHAVAQQSWRRLPPSVEIGGMPEDAIFASPQRRFLPEGASPQRAPLFWGGGGSPHAPTP